MQFTLKTKYSTSTAEIVFGRHLDGSIAMEFINPSTGEVLTRGTVNLEEYNHKPDLTKREVFIKDWSENEEVLQSLIDAQLVVDTGKRIPTGYVITKVATLTQAAYDEFERQRKEAGLK